MFFWGRIKIKKIYICFVVCFVCFGCNKKLLFVVVIMNVEWEKVDKYLRIKIYELDLGVRDYSLI